ncbi:MAG TPA: 3'-5' exonuclease, partial [Ilumatobacteraceae bacterium]
EAQDLNPLQHRVVDLLRAGNDDLFLVGDPAQAVYGFNGADPGLLVDVDHRFPGIEIVRLPTNHRCTPQVVQAGAHVLDASGHDPAVESGRPDGRSVRVTSCADDDAEAQIVARRLGRLDPGLLAAGHVAVLARTHSQLARLRVQIEAERVPIRRLADGPGSPYRAAIAVAARLGSAARLRSWAHDVVDGPDELPDGLDVEPATEVASAVFDFLRDQPLGDGTGFRSWIATSDPFGIRADSGVELLTFHGAKGREWHTVFVTGVETGLVPHRSAGTAAARAEEARLLYVALTRATEVLEVTWAARRGGYQRRISPLLAEYVPSVDQVAPPPPDLIAAHRSAPTGPNVLATLTAWRDHAARAAGILPESLLSDAALKHVALDPPSSPDELAAKTGIGLLTARRLFEGIDAALADQSRRSTTTGA